MSLDDRFEWRETYFILFPSGKRPSLKQVETAVQRLGAHLELGDREANEQGLLESLHVRSPEDHSALEIDYISGEEVSAQVAELTKQLRGETAERDKLARLKNCDARFEIMHFEEMDAFDPDEADEAFDPSALLAVLDALVDLTGGVGVDPQSGTLL
ncbi:MAG TPA: hypothetical protein VG826_16185 [Pirellulales bacterium]|nr:hypothetical protein [Pirellulales bacterium]